MSTAPSTIAIVFKRVELFAHVGEHRWEQHPERPTRLLIDLTITFDYREYFEEYDGYVDYDPLRAFLKGLQDRPHINKLEEFAKQILNVCFAGRGTKRVKLSVIKPDVFPEMAGVGVALDVAREDYKK
jgi:dihydroneopterin aldolase